MRRNALLAVVGLVVVLGLVWWAFWPSGEATVAEGTPDHHVDDGEQSPEARVRDELRDAGVQEVSGEVVDPRGDAVVGATVQLFIEAGLPWGETCAVCGQVLFDCTDPATAQKTIDRLARHQLIPKPWGVTTTDSEGHFTFVDAPDVGIRLIARTSSMGGTAEGDERTIVVGPPSERTVKVVQDDESPVPGAHLIGLTHALELVELTAGADGRASFMAFADGWFLSSEPGYLPAAVNTEGSQLVLSKPRTLHVHTRTGGQPIDADVTVTLHGGDKVFRTRNGELTLEQLGSSALAISVSTATLAASVAMVDLPKPENDLTVELRASGKLLITVVDEQGLPVKNASASLESLEASANATDPGEGAMLTLGPLPEGEYTLMISADGMREARRVHDLTPGEKSLEVTLTHAAVLRGKVMGPSGPAASVLVSMSAPGLPDNSMVTAEDGTFSFEGPPMGDVVLDAFDQAVGRAQAHASMPGNVTLTLTPRAVLQLEVSDSAPLDLGRCEVTDAHGQRYRVSFTLDDSKLHGTAKVAGLSAGSWRVFMHARHREDVERQVTIAEGAVMTERFTLSAGVTIEGQVVDPEGKPMPNVSVGIRGQGESTDEAGKFQFSGVKPGPIRVSASLADDLTVDPVEVEAPARGVVLKAKRAPKVSGLVVDKHGAPVKDYEANGVSVHDPAGKFTVPVRMGQLSIWADGFKPASVDVEVNKTDVGTITLEAVDFAEGEVVDADGRPIGGVSVRVIPSGSEGVTGANGRFKVEAGGQFDGSEKPEVVATRGSALGRVPYKPGSNHHLQLGRGTHVSGRVSAQGKPLANMTVQIEGRGELWANRTETTDAQGHFEVDLWPGTWTFTASGVRIARTVEVAGDRLEIELGGELGRCSLQITNAPELDSILLEPKVPDDDTTGSYRPGTIEITGLHGQPSLSHSVPCGDYMMTLSQGASGNSTAVHLDGNAVYDARVLNAATPPEPGITIIREPRRIVE